jgi:hypothetical protein
MWRRRDGREHVPPKEKIQKIAFNIYSIFQILKVTRTTWSPKDTSLNSGGFRRAPLDSICSLSKVLDLKPMLSRIDSSSEILTCHTRFQKANRMRTMYVPGSVIHVHSSYIIWTSSHSAQNSISKGNSRLHHTSETSI